MTAYAWHFQIVNRTYSNRIFSSLDYYLDACIWHRLINSTMASTGNSRHYADHPSWRRA